MKIALGNDHGAFALKEFVLGFLSEKGWEVEDCGASRAEVGVHDIDYPDYAKKVADAVLSGECVLGVLLCGTGVGMSIAANKLKGIRACVCSDVFSGRMSREHNNANILCLGERVVGFGLAGEILDAFFSAEFQGGRHARRIDKICELEK